MDEWPCYVETFKIIGRQKRFQRVERGRGVEEFAETVYASRPKAEYEVSGWDLVAHEIERKLLFVPFGCH